MFDVDDIRDWVGLAVVDQEGAKIGTLEAVYYDTSTDVAKFGTVKVGFPGRGRLISCRWTALGIAQGVAGPDDQKGGQGCSGHRHRR